MKITVCGTHCVEKTTLAEDLPEHLPGYILVMEPYHDMEASGIVFAEIPGVDDYIDQFHRSVKRIAKSEDKVIFDRCPVELPAYIHATAPVIHSKTVSNGANHHGTDRCTDLCPD